MMEEAVGGSTPGGGGAEEEEAPPVPSTSEPAGAVREEMVGNAVQFLRHPKVAGAGSEEKRTFLRNKGLTEAEIAEAERRASVPAGVPGVGGGAGVPVRGGAPPVPVYQQAAEGARMGHSGAAAAQMRMGLGPPPPPPPQRRSPRVTSVLLVASVLTGATYGVGWVMRRLVFPSLVPVLRGVSWLRWLADLMARLSLPPLPSPASPPGTPRGVEALARSDLKALAMSVEKQFGALEARLEAMASGVVKLESKLGEHHGQVDQAIKETRASVVSARLEVKQQVEEAVRNAMPESPFAPEARAMREVREDMAAVKRVLKIDGQESAGRGSSGTRAPPSPIPYWPADGGAGQEWGDAIDQRLDGLSSGSSLLAQAQEAANNIISDRARKGKAPASESEEPMHGSPQSPGTQDVQEALPPLPLTPYSQSYAEVMEMLQKGITPPNVNTELDDTPPDPNAQVQPGASPPASKPWSSPGSYGSYSKNPYLAVARQPELGKSTLSSNGSNSSLRDAL